MDRLLLTNWILRKTVILQVGYRIVLLRKTDKCSRLNFEILNSFSDQGTRLSFHLHVHKRPRTRFFIMLFPHE